MKVKNENKITGLILEPDVPFNSLGNCFRLLKRTETTEERQHNTSGTRIIIESLIKHLLFAIISIYSY